MKGQDLCYHHGGNSPLNRAKGAEVLERQQWTNTVALLGIEAPESVDPRDALAQELCRAVGAEAVLRTLVSALELTEGGLYRRD
jgi:hypothetical protein